MQDKHRIREAPKFNTRIIDMCLEQYKMQIFIFLEDRMHVFLGAELWSIRLRNDLVWRREK